MLLTAVIGLAIGVFGLAALIVLSSSVAVAAGLLVLGLVPGAGPLAALLVGAAIAGLVMPIVHTLWMRPLLLRAARSTRARATAPAKDHKQSGFSIDLGYVINPLVKVALWNALAPHVGAAPFTTALEPFVVLLVFDIVARPVLSRVTRPVTRRLMAPVLKAVAFEPAPITQPFSRPAR